MDIIATNSDILFNILALIPVGVFWKDKDRKFLGANQMFLDYYGFTSVEDILGKTDEDMGWHIDPEPYRSIELRVSNNGEIIKELNLSNFGINLPSLKSPKIKFTLLGLNFKFPSKTALNSLFLKCEFPLKYLKIGNIKTSDKI